MSQGAAGPRVVRGSVRGSVRGELAPSARGGVRQPSKRVSALELDLALLTSCTFPPVTKSKYTHAVVCTVTPGQRTRTLPRTLPRTQPAHKMEISQRDAAGKIPGWRSYNTRSKRCFLKEKKHFNETIWILHEI